MSKLEFVQIQCGCHGNWHFVMVSLSRLQGFRKDLEKKSLNAVRMLTSSMSQSLNAKRVELQVLINHHCLWSGRYEASFKLYYYIGYPLMSTSKFMRINIAIYTSLWAKIMKFCILACPFNQMHDARIFLLFHYIRIVLSYFGCDVTTYHTLAFLNCLRKDQWVQAIVVLYIRNTTWGIRHLLL